MGLFQINKHTITINSLQKYAKMKALKLYTGSIGFNLMPIIAMRLIMGDTIGDENMGYVVFGVFFIIALFLNSSFFFINFEYIQKSRIKVFLSYYLSSTFLFILGTLLVLYDCFANSINSIEDFLFRLMMYFSYFIINLLYVLYIKQRLIKSNLTKGWI